MTMSDDTVRTQLLTLSEDTPVRQQDKEDALVRKATSDNDNT